jgi:hypothetical protein
VQKSRLPVGLSLTDLVQSVSWADGDKGVTDSCLVQLPKDCVTPATLSAAFPSTTFCTPFLCRCARCARCLVLP